IQFEGFAPAGGLVNVNPGAPYTEAGFTFTPLNSSSAVFDANAAVDFPGNSASSFLGFQETNTITMTGGVFSLASVLIGRSTLPACPAINATITGHLFGGGTLTTTLTGLTTATTATLNWNGLADVVFSVTDDGAIDNISTDAVPEPGSLLLLGAG